MENKIRDHVRGLFAEAPDTRRTYELREEIIQNLLDKFNDLAASGTPEEEAFQIVVASIGNVDELIEDLEDSTMQDPNYDKQRARSAVLTAVAVMLYILSVVPVFLFGLIGGREEIGIIIMFAVIAIATGLIVFNQMTKPRRRSDGDSIVDDFKEWQDGKSNRNEVYKAVSGALWSLTLVIYFVVSFLTMAWYITWVIFLIAVAVQNIIRVVLEMRR